MQFYILYQGLGITSADISFRKYYNDGTTWKTAKELQDDNKDIGIIKAYEV